MEFLYVALGLIAMLTLGIPIYVALGVLTVIMFITEDTPLLSLVQIYVDNLNSITLVAIPFFIMAAQFMQKGGIARALVNWANSWVGSFQGGLAIVCVVATTIFSAISGSSVATAVAMGLILVPAMLEHKYERHFAVGLVGASGTLGILIPPSLSMIVYAVIAEESVPRLFLAGVVPGLMQGALFIAYSVWYAKRRNYPRTSRLPRNEFKRVNIYALPALSIPVIILGGIYSGIVTVSEAAGVAALVAILVSVFFYKGCTLRQVPSIVGESMRSTAIIFFIIMAAVGFGHWLTSTGGPHILVDWVVGLNLETWQFLLLINLFFLILGTFLEVLAIMLITLPIILPLLVPMGVDPVHFAALMVINMELALLTPPIGLNIFVISSITKTSVSQTTRGVLPFMGLLFILLMLVTFIPQISLWLPNLVYGIRPM